MGKLIPAALKPPQYIPEAVKNKTKWKKVRSKNVEATKKKINNFHYVKIKNFFVL